MRISPTVRGFAIIIAVAAAITALGAEEGLDWIFFALQILFLIAIAYALYRFWRNNRQEISLWRRRSQVVFYGAAILAIVNIAASFALTYPENGLEALVFFVVLGLCAFSMWRIWRDEHTYGY